MKCTFDIIRNASPAGTEKIALITPIIKYSDSVVISTSDIQDEAITAKPDKIAKTPAAKFFFTGYTGAVFLSKMLIIIHTINSASAIPIVV